MTGQEIAEKFKSMASKFLTEEQMRQLIETVFDLDKLGDVAKLNRLMVFKRA
jgi:hypothetical protein